MKRELTEEMGAFLAEKRFGVVGTTNPNGSPHVTVMWYLFDRGEIVFNTMRGRLKDRNLRRDPRASFLVADGYRFVRVDGRVRIVEDQGPAHSDILRMAIRYNGPERGEQQAREQFAAQERISYHLPVREVYAQGF